jgi:molybdopterin synthase sulfur carrier subunit
MPEIKVPAALTGGSSSETVAVEGATVREAFESHAEEHGPELHDSVVEAGEIKEYINVFVDGEQVAHLDGLDTRLEDDDTIRVVPAASGGRR